MNKNGLVMRTVVIMALLLATLTVLLVVFTGLFKGGSSQLLGIGDDLILPGQAGQTQRPTAPAELSKAFDNIVEVFMGVAQSQSDHCIVTYSPLPKDMKDFTIEVKDFKNTQGKKQTIINLKNKDNQVIKEAFIDKVQPCIVGGELDEQPKGACKKKEKGKTILDSPFKLPAKNFYNNWIKVGPSTQRIGKYSQFCTPEYTQTDVVITDTEEIQAGKEYSLEDLNLRYNSDLINLLYVPEKGKACFMVYRDFFDDPGKEGIDDEIPVQFNNQFYNEEGEDENYPRGSTMIPFCP